MQNGMFKHEFCAEGTDSLIVPGFQTPKAGLLSRLISSKRKLTAELYSLPEVSKRWKPDNVSRREKYASLLNYAKNAPGFPDPEIPEYYHTQEEIERMRLLDFKLKNARTVKIADGI
jgi:hypothetical protein